MYHFYFYIENLHVSKNCERRHFEVKSFEERKIHYIDREFLLKEKIADKRSFIRRAKQSYVQRTQPIKSKDIFCHFC